MPFTGIPDSKWAWSETEKKQRKVAPNGWQQFYLHWRSKDFKFDDKPDHQFPYVLQLGVNSDGDSLLPFHKGDTFKGQILVTKSYEKMFYHLWRLRRRDKGNTRGAVITGQPGVGAFL